MKSKPRAIAIAFCLILLLPACARAYYSPEQGRWISRDLIEEQGGVNLHNLAGNEPIAHVDVWGLCGECICRDAEITFAPGGTKFEFGITKDPDTGKPPVKLGNNITVKWIVQGSCKLCEFRQDEREIEIKSGYNEDGSAEFEGLEQKGKDRVVPGDNVSEDCSYVDRLGVHLQKVGFYYTRLKGKIIFSCKGTDGKTKSKTFQVEGDALGVVPHAPGAPYVKRQTVKVSTVE